MDEEDDGQVTALKQRERTLTWLRSISPRASFWKRFDKDRADRFRITLPRRLLTLRGPD